jgi:hypothetical protein
VPLAEEAKDFQADEAFSVSDFKLGEDPKIGSRQARLIQYTLVTKGLELRKGKTRFAVGLWVDEKTKLPLKRVVVPQEQDLGFVLTETYTSFTLDGKIDAKKFALPWLSSRRAESHHASSANHGPVLAAGAYRNLPARRDR